MGRVMTPERLAELSSAIDQLGQQRVTFTHWDPFILGDADDLATELMTAREAGQREIERWRAGRFDSVQLAVADAVFSKQQDYRSAVRSATRPFAAAFRSMPLAAFSDLESGEVFRRTFGREPNRDKERAHLSPEGRIRTICEVSRLLVEAAVGTVEDAREALAAAPPDLDLARRLKRVFGFGPAMLANLRMNVGVLTAKPDVHVKRFLAPFMGVSETAQAQTFIKALEQLRDATGLEPFEVDQVIWYAKAVSGRVKFTTKTAACFTERLN